MASYPSQGGGYRQSGPPPTPAGMTEAAAREVLAGEGSAIAEHAKRLASDISQLKRAQIRSFYGPITRLRASQQSDPASKLNKLHLMRPRLYYMAARERQAIPLRDAFEKIIVMAKPIKEQIEAIFDFAEAVVAYHREHAKD